MMQTIVGFESSLVAPTLVIGIAATGVYGLLAVPLVMTYRVSRTIGFVQGGIALFSMFLYWWLSGTGSSFDTTTRMGKVPGLLIVMVLGAVLGVIYGWTVMGKLANWPRVRLTTYSLSWLLGLAALSIIVFLRPESGFQTSLGATVRVPSLFGDSRYKLFGVVINSHQIATVTILLALMVALGFVLHRTRIGIFIRAIADDPEAAPWVGIPLSRVGAGVYACAGAMSALAGVLMTSSVGLDFFLTIAVFFRALTVSVLGGFQSLFLAIAGCAVLGITEATFQTQFPNLEQGIKEMVLTGMLFGLIFLINRLRPVRVIGATAQ